MTKKRKKGKREQVFLSKLDPPFPYSQRCYQDDYLIEITVPSSIVGKMCGAAKTAPGKTSSIGSWK